MAPKPGKSKGSNASLQKALDDFGEKNDPGSYTVTVTVKVEATEGRITEYTVNP